MRSLPEGFFFFFQAEDGIRDLIVTGVQTCALPIWITADTLTAFSAMRRLYCLVAPAVSPVNNGISDTGSTTTKNTTKNLSGCSSIDGTRHGRAPRRNPPIVLESVKNEAQHRL